MGGPAGPTPSPGDNVGGDGQLGGWRSRVRAAVGACFGVAAGALFTLGAVLVLDDGGSGSDGDDRTLAGVVAPTADSAADRGGDVLVFLDQDVTDAQRQSIEAWLDGRPEIAS